MGGAVRRCHEKVSATYSRKVSKALVPLDPFRPLYPVLLTLLFFPILCTAFLCAVISCSKAG